MTTENAYCPALKAQEAKDAAMTKHAADFKNLMASIEAKFYDLPAPGSDEIRWTHVGDAEHVCNGLRDVLQFLTR
jgi:hypothetical protein